MPQAGDPVTATRFRVEIDGLTASDFVEVLLPEASRGTGGEQFTPLVLRRGASADRELADWWRQAALGKAAPKNVSVILLDGRGEAQIRWIFTRAEPLRYAISRLNSLEPAVLVETMELKVEGFERG